MTLAISIEEGEGEDESRSNLLITVLAMIFTIISILLSAFEYILSSKFVKNGSVLIIKFVFESHTIADLGGRKFLNKVVFGKVHKVTHVLSKSLRLNFVQIERLIPIQSNKGATFLFIIDADAARFDSIWKKFITCVNNGTICDQLRNIYKIQDECWIPPTEIFRVKLNGKSDDTDGTQRIQSIVDSRASTTTLSMSSKVNTTGGIGIVDFNSDFEGESQLTQFAPDSPTSTTRTATAGIFSNYNGSNLSLHDGKSEEI